MSSFRPLSILALRLPQLLAWTVDPQPSWNRQDLLEKKRQIMEFMASQVSPVGFKQKHIA